MRCRVVAAIVAVGLAAAVRAEEAKFDSPFNGKDLAGWKYKGDAKRSKWTVGLAKLDPSDPKKLVVAKVEGGAVPELVNSEGRGVDLYSEATWGDCTVDIELMVPKGSNSGIYMMGEYEVQVLDSYGKEKVGPGDIGGLYGAQAPRLNASKAPGEWQRFVIEFQAPRFEEGKKTANAKFIKVTLNGQVIHDNVEMKKPTPGGVTGKEAPKGPIMFQGDHGPVSYRNIKVFPK
jgi:hypothetical protein